MKKNDLLTKSPWEKKISIAILKKATTLNAQFLVSCLCDMVCNLTCRRQPRIQSTASSSCVKIAVKTRVRTVFLWWCRKQKSTSILSSFKASEFLLEIQWSSYEHYHEWMLITPHAFIIESQLLNKII